MGLRDMPGNKKLMICCFIRTTVEAPMFHIVFKGSLLFYSGSLKF